MNLWQPHNSIDRMPIDRRQWLQCTSLASCGVLAGGTLAGSLQAAEKKYEPLNRYPRMVHEWFVDQVRRLERRNLRRLEELKTKEDAEAYVESVRKRIRACFGPEPERTPLAARVTGTVERDQYKIENVIFESRPGFPVTANLYIPTGRDYPLPGVIGSCGHSTNGKAAEAYQSFAQGLARLGYVCLIFDPIGQGERLQYVTDELKSEIGVGVHEHLYAGNQQFLVGDFFGMWRAWDGIRALDYLLTRPEVDKQHIGVTGNSGGGTMTTWLCGLDSRWTMAAPSCFVTTFRRNLENELPADTEQCPPMALALGLDHGDFIAAMAPKPVILLTKEKDFFDVRGSEETFERLKRLYALLGKEENIQLFTGPTTHGYSQENREAMYEWFNRATKVSDTSKEPELTIEKDETLWCTPKGQVATLEDNKTIFHFTARKAESLEKSRGRVSDEALPKTIARVLKLPRHAIPENTSGESAQGTNSSEKRPAPDYSIWSYLGSRGYASKSAVAYSVQTEPGIEAIVYRLTSERWQSRPPKAGNRAMLYVAHLSSDDELRSEPLVRELVEAEPKVPLFTCDVRGIGESQPDTCQPNSFHNPYGSDYFYAIHSLMLDRPYLGQKTYDVLRVIDWLESLGHTEVHLIGKGRGALAATFAAVLSPAVGQVTLKNALTSYADIAKSEHYEWPLAALPFNALAHFDLPDCYRALKAKQLRQIDPWDAMAGQEKHPKGA